MVWTIDSPWMARCGAEMGLASFPHEGFAKARQSQCVARKTVRNQGIEHILKYAVTRVNMASSMMIQVTSQRRGANYGNAEPRARHVDCSGE